MLVADTPPVGAQDNALWWESDSGQLYFRYNDGNSTQWVSAVPTIDEAALKAYADNTAKLYSGKNYIINGAMMISQENGATAGSAIYYYAVDQFMLASSNAGTQTAQQVASPTPGGSLNRLRVTATVADASVGAGDYSQIVQHIEGLRCADLRFGSSAAKTITVQFGVKAPAGTYCVTVQNVAGNRSYVAEYTISAGEANTDTVKRMTVPGDMVGTWASDNTSCISIHWTLMVGTTFQQAAGSWGTVQYALGSTNQYNFMSVANSVFELFDVSLTEGAVAPPFKVPDYASELAACKRYYTKDTTIIQVPASGVMISLYNLKTEMRASPTVVFSNVTYTLASSLNLNFGGVQTLGLQLTASSASGYASFTLAANARL